MKGILIMSHKERHRLKILVQIQKRQMTYREAAEDLTLSNRQVYRLMQQYHKQGDAGLIHHLRGKPSNRGYSETIRTRVLTLHKHQYHDYGPTLLGEMLTASHKLQIDHETLRRWLRSAGRNHFERRKRPHTWCGDDFCQLTSGQGTSRTSSVIIFVFVSHMLPFERGGTYGEESDQIRSRAVGRIVSR